MLIVRFGGGLGNQLFQFAMMITIADRYNVDVEYDSSSYLYFNEHEGFDLPKYFGFPYKKMDIVFLRKISPLKYFLIKFNKQIPNLKSYSLMYKINKVFNAIIKCFSKNVRIISDSNLGKISDLDALNSNEITYFDGRWQDISYYDLDYLREKICFKVELNGSDTSMLKRITETVSVSVHVRRGDFTVNLGFDICSEEYYQDAVKKLLQITGLEINEITFFFFGDDHDYIKCHFNYPNMVIVQGSSAGVDMYLMSNCKYNIIANSTFSFWGAILNKNKNLVIAPKYSFVNNKRKEMFSVPDYWITINNIKGDL